MKTVVVDKTVRDVEGLLAFIRKQNPEFRVISVGADLRYTYIYLDDNESGDPTQFVMDWEEVPELRAASMNRVGADKVPAAEADGRDVHTVLIQKLSLRGELLDGNGKVNVVVPMGIIVTPHHPSLKNGATTISVGPSRTPRKFTLEVKDPQEHMISHGIELRFNALYEKRKDPIEGVPQNRQKAFQKIRKILRF